VPTVPTDDPIVLVEISYSNTLARFLAKLVKAGLSVSICAKEGSIQCTRNSMLGVVIVFIKIDFFKRLS
jgi:hypothetical protein